MDTKTELVALGIRVLSTKTTLIRQPNAIEDLCSELFGIETYDQRLAKNVVAEAERVVAVVKRIATNRKFKKIVEKI